jgi:hypothetical protein
MRRSVATSAIKHARECAGMNIAVLLGQLRTRKKSNLHFALCNSDELRAQGGHQPLGREACGDLLLQIRHLGSPRSP